MSNVVLNYVGCPVVTLNRNSSVLQSWRMSNVALNCVGCLNRDSSVLQSWWMSNVALNCVACPVVTLNGDSSVLQSWRMSNVALNCVISPEITLDGDRYVSARTVSHVCVGATSKRYRRVHLFLSIYRRSNQIYILRREGHAYS